MNIGKNKITFGIKQLTMFFPDFDRFVDKKGIENIVDSWDSMFKKIEYDYDLAEQHFKQAIYNIIYTSKTTPSFSDVLNAMRELNKEYELQRIRNKS